MRQGIESIFIYMWKEKKRRGSWKEHGYGFPMDDSTGTSG